MKKLSLFVALLSSNLAIAGTVDGGQQLVQCTIPGCTLQCQTPKQGTQTYGPVKRIRFEVLPSGVSKYELEKEIGGRQLVLVGPDAYMCAIDGAE